MRPIPLVLCLALCLAAGTSPAVSFPRELRSDEAEEVAAGRRPYLVLDLGTRRLTLWQGGARLRDYTVLRTEIGAPRLGDLFGGPISEVPAGAWAPYRVVPERAREHIEIRSDRPIEPDPSASVPWVPLLPQELNPTPCRFLIRYRGGLGLEVVPDPSESAGRRGDWAALALFGHRDRLRLRLVLSEPDAGALYRSGAVQAVLLIVPAS